MRIQSLLLAFVFISSGAVAQSVLLNGGFETWNTVGGYQEPEGWSTLNSFTTGVQTVTKETTAANVHSGTASLKVQTLTVSGQPQYGFLTTGHVNSASGTAKGATPFSGSVRPVALTGWYKYSAVNGDSALIHVFVYKAGGQATSPAQGRMALGNNSGWKQFSIPIYYQITGVPDSIRISVYSSGNVPAELNSTLWLDDLAWSYASDVQEPEESTLGIFPNPVSAKGWITAQLNSERYQGQEVSFKIYNLIGEQVYQQTGTLNASALAQYDLSPADLPKGVYFCSIISGYKTIANSKLVVE
jgi:hypothetical protein